MTTNNLNYTDPVRIKVSFADLPLGSAFVWAEMCSRIEEAMKNYCTGIKVSPDEWYSFQDERVLKTVTFSNVVFALKMKKIDFGPVFENSK